ncbi:UNVERIFIED_CONTAM: hypothetical protein K2H54_001007 [Gekko kuhli]
MKTFFPPNMRSEEENKETAELISDQIEDELLPDTLTIRRQELLDIHKDLHRSLSDIVERLIHPINSRLDNFMAELCETTKKADTNAASCVLLWEELDNGVAPTIAKAYRLGSLARAAKGHPRDILANFVYPRSRDRVLKEARFKGTLLYRERKNTDTA